MRAGAFRHPGATCPRGLAGKRMAASWASFRGTGGKELRITSPYALRSLRRRLQGEPALSAQVGDLAVQTAPVIRLHPGTAEPLGPSLAVANAASAVNFSVFSSHATSMTLVLLVTDGEPAVEIPLSEANGHRTGDHWHVAIEGLPLSGVRYAYRAAGPGGWDSGSRWDPRALLLDPYAPLVALRPSFGVPAPDMFKIRYGMYDLGSAPFDWGEAESRRPRHASADLVIYEMGVRQFTADPSSGVAPDRAGSYLGVVDKIDHLVALGVTAVELLPVFEFDEMEFKRSKNPRDHMVNTWGYSTMAFFAPMSRYGTAGSTPAEAAQQLKTLVRALHAAGIEVILDVVYNHTAEGGDDDPYLLSMRGLDASVYYMMDPGAKHALRNFSGCGNTLNCSHPVVRRLVVDSLKHWTEEYHIDGFRFDLASALTRGTDGTPLSDPPLIRAMTHDPALAGVKLIAEPWDCGGLYQVGSFPNWDRWAEWNGKFRDDVRSFVRGDPGKKSALATRLAGSADLYKVNQRKPYHSINFVIAHDGFTLRDLVTYSSKRNSANGEGGRDGTNDNFSWNCGAEGDTADAGVLALRARQMRNLTLVLLMSAGTPMVLMGDEYGRSTGGNNNTYGLDGPLTWFQWGAMDAQREGLFRFTAGLIALRRMCPFLRRADFLAPKDVTWHESRWDDAESRFLALTLHDHDRTAGGSLYMALNAHGFFVEADLPAAPQGTAWRRLADTNLPPPNDWTPERVGAIAGKYNIAPHSCLLLQARS